MQDDALVCHDPLNLSVLALVNTLPILVLAPHPDDFDSVGVTLRLLYRRGNPLHVAVATSGASGVEDAFCSPPTVAAKAALREEEQRASCRFFGLPEERLAFLHLEEDTAGHPFENDANADCIRRHLLSVRPALVFLPHGNDTNAGHRRIYATFRRVAQEIEHPLAAFLNRDPKTVHMQCDVYTPFGEDLAAWKGELLRFHRSQHQRNLNQRGAGFDERILAVDRQNAVACSADAPYAEAFEIECLGLDRGGILCATKRPLQ